MVEDEKLKRARDSKLFFTTNEIIHWESDSVGVQSFYGVSVESLQGLYGDSTGTLWKLYYVFNFHVFFCRRHVSDHRSLESLSMDVASGRCNYNEVTRDFRSEVDAAAAESHTKFS